VIFRDLVELCSKCRPPSSLPLLAFIALGGALMWSLFGCLIAALSGSIHLFWREWLYIQGFFAVAAALFLGLMALSPALSETVQQASHCPKFECWSDQQKIARLRRVVIIFIMIVGTITTTRLGFTVPPPTRYFMWLTCTGVCAMAGFITWHAIEVLYTATKISEFKIKFFVYSPGETRSLKKLAVYFVTFSLSVTVGYIFAFAGTMSPLWRGNSTWINGVRAFWPVIYVPLCLAITTYPHLVIHRVIRQEKDRLIISYQEQINSLIGDAQSLSKQDIERVNALADLIKRIESSPSFALNFPIAIGAALTYIVNIGSLFISKELVGQILRKLLRM